MKKHSMEWKCLLPALLAGCLLLPDTALAQFFGGGGGGGVGRGGTTGGSANTRREYYSHGMVGEAMISVDPETRRIIVITDEITNTHIEDVIKSLDRPKPQVLIKVVFVEVTHRNDSEFGLEYLGPDGAITASFGPAGGLATGGTWQLVTEDLTATLKAIAEKGKTEVLSRPSILTRNNQEAVITIGDEVPFITNSQITDDGRTINTVQYDDVGIILRVTPFISDDGTVEMIVAPEISSIGERTVPISDTVSVPVINKRSAETVVVTRHAQTVVIGGLMQNNLTETTRKVPLLGDIPLLGLAFRRKAKVDTKTELLIFLTPYVVSETSGIAGLNEAEARRSQLTPKTFSQRDLDSYLEGVPIEASDAKNEPDEKKTVPAPRAGTRRGHRP